MIHLADILAEATAHIQPTSPVVADTAITDAVDVTTAANGGASCATVRVWPVCGRKARALGLGVSFRLWSWLNHIDTAGSGRYALTPAFKERLADGLGISPRSVSRAISAGVGLFWHIDDADTGHYLRRAGFTAVHRELTAQAAESGVENATEKDQRPCELPLDSVIDGVGAFYAALFAAWVSVQTNESITARYEDLERLWSVTGRQVRNWLARAGFVAVDENIGQEDIGAAPSERQALNDLYRAARDHDSREWFVIRDGRLYRRWQRANTYHCVESLQSPHRGQASRTFYAGAADNPDQNRGDTVMAHDDLAPALVGQVQRLLTAYPSLQRMTAQDRRGALLDLIDAELYRASYGRTNFSDAKRLAKMKRKHPAVDAYLHTDRVLIRGQWRSVWSYAPAGDSASFLR